MRLFHSYNSFIEAVYQEPSFDSPGTSIPNDHGQCYENLNGKVRFASSFHYKYVNGKKTIDGECYSAFFGTDNQIRHYERTDKDGTLVKAITYLFDENGRCIEQITIDGRGEITSHTVHKYNEQGLLASSEYKSGGKNVYIYDSKGFLVEQRWDSTSFENSWKELFINDEQGREIEMKEYRGRYGSNDYWFSRKILTKYNEYGHIIERKNVENSGKEKALSFDEYDDKGRVVKIGSSILTYDAHNRVKLVLNPDYNTSNHILYDSDNSICILWLNGNQVITKKRKIVFDCYNNITSILYYEGEDLHLTMEDKYVYEYYPE